MSSVQPLAIRHLASGHGATPTTTSGPERVSTRHLASGHGATPTTTSGPERVSTYRLPATTFSMGEHNCAWCLVCLGVVVAIAASVVVALSFAYVNYHEFGFKRQRSTGKVDTSTVYKEGRYLWGPDFDTLVYPADAHFLDLNAVDIFTFDKLEVKLTAHMQFFLREDQLALLHKKFHVHYETVMVASATDALKGAVPIYTTRELVANRTNVEMDLFKAVKQRLGGICCRADCNKDEGGCPTNCKPEETCTDDDKGLFADVRYFQLGAIQIPTDVQARFMETLVLQETTLRAQLIQDGAVVRKDTEAKVDRIKNDAYEITQNATAVKNRLVKIATAQYDRVVQGAHVTGLQGMFSFLNVSDETKKASINYLRALEGNPKAKLTVDFDQRIAGTL